MQLNGNESEEDAKSVGGQGEEESMEVPGPDVHGSGAEQKKHVEVVHTIMSKEVRDMHGQSEAPFYQKMSS